MKQIDRLKQGPQNHKISSVSIKAPSQYLLSSGVPLYGYKTSGIGAIKLEIIFEAGRLYEKKRLVAQSCASLITEGCKNISSDDISEAIEYEGGYLSSNGNSDFITIKLTCTKNSFEKLLPILSEIISAPSFSQEELNLFVNRRKQKMTVNLTKNDVISYRAITESLYGAESAYGYNSTYKMLEALTPPDLKEHYTLHCSRKNAVIFVSGDYSDNNIKKIEDLSLNIKETNVSTPIYQSTKTIKQTLRLKGRENQSSLKLGLPLFARNDHRYSNIYILNTLLGGYFGSRLMKNIREKNGYTYNIYSMLDTYKYDGAWIISCELAEEYLDRTLIEISKEFDRLKTEMISDKELQMLKNYMLGSFMSTISGPFKAINPSKMEIMLGLQPSFYNNLSADILAIEAKDIQLMAKEFLNMDNFWKVIVGKA